MYSVVDTEGQSGYPKPFGKYGLAVNPTGCGSATLMSLYTAESRDLKDAFTEKRRSSF